MLEIALDLEFQNRTALTQRFDLTKTRFTAFKQVLLDRENCQKNQRDWFDLLAILSDDEVLAVI